MAETKKPKPKPEDTSLGTGAAEKVKDKIVETKTTNQDQLNKIRRQMGLPPIKVVNEEKKMNSKYGVGK